MPFPTVKVKVRGEVRELPLTHVLGIGPGSKPDWDELLPGYEVVETVAPDADGVKWHAFEQPA